MAVQRKIFISYRRVDNPDFADRIRDWFIMRYRRENVFMDFDSIPPGVRFADHIRSSMKQSDAVIAIIGSRWLELLQEKAAKFEDDFVRIELSLALELGKPITPICIGGASVPARSSLPPDLRPLLDYNIVFLDRTNFYERIERIIAAVEVALDAAQQTEEQPTSSDQAEVSAAELALDAAQQTEEQPTSSDQAEVSAAELALDAAQQTEEQPTSSDQAEVSAVEVALEVAQQTTKLPMSSDQAEVWHKIEKTELSAEDYFNRAFARYEKGDRDGAITDYSEAIRLNPQFAKAYNNRGIARRTKGDLDGAIADYDEAIRFNPQFAEAYNNRGIARRTKGDLDGAIADCDEAIRFKPQYISAYVARGLVHNVKGNYEDAIADYNEALRINPQYAVAYNNRGNARDNKGDYEEAIADFSEAIRLNPRYADAYNNRGVARYHKHDYDSAIVDYTCSIELKNPELHLPYYNRGESLEAKGDLRGAIQNYQKYLDLGGGKRDGDQAKVEQMIRELENQPKRRKLFR